jgi:hypothetical protein
LNVREQSNSAHFNYGAKFKPNYFAFLDYLALENDIFSLVLKNSNESLKISCMKNGLDHVHLRESLMAN